MIKRKLAIIAAIVAPPGLFLWARSVASWRPQKVTAQPVSLVQDAIHGPWVDEGGALRNLETEQRIIVPVERREDEPRISPDGRSMAFSYFSGNNTSGYSPFIEWRQCASGRILRRFDEFFGDYFAPPDFQFSPSGSNLLLLAGDGMETLPLDGSPARFVPLPEMKDFQILSDDGKWLCFESRPENPHHDLRVYDVQTRRLHTVIKHGRSCVTSSAFSTDASLLCFADTQGPGEDRGAWVADAKTGAKLWDLNWFTPGFQFSPDSQMLLIFDSDGSNPKVELRVARTGKRLGVLQFPKPVHQALFSRDGNFIYALDEDGTLWKMRAR